MTTTKNTKAATDKSEAAFKAGTEAAEKALENGKKNFDKAITVGADTFAKNYDKTIAATREQIEKYFPAVASAFDEAAEMNKSYFDAFLAATNAATKGWETFGKEVLAYQQKSIDASIANGKALIDSKTPQEALSLQTDFAKANVEEMMRQASKFSELSVKTAKEAFEPLNARFTETVQKATKPLAA